MKRWVTISIEKNSDNTLSKFAQKRLLASSVREFYENFEQR